MTEQAASRRSKPSAREINDTIRYTAWTAFGRTGEEVPAGTPARLEDAVAALAERDIVVRGLYDVSAMRAGADLLAWVHAPAAEQVQHGVRELRRCLGEAAAITWSGMAIHRPAEFNKGHVPAFMAGEAAQEWLCVYPFVRSYEWYLLPEEERRAMLVEHGTMGRGYTSIRSNTVSAFALGDYEWILALESPVLHDIVDMMRHLRASQARRHVREEVPFHTGRLVSPAEAAEVLR